MSRHTISDYPVGATWEAKSESGKIGRIWLERRSRYTEMWMWSDSYSDNGGGTTDWNPSYYMCRNEIPIWNKSGKKLIFKRIK